MSQWDKLLARLKTIPNDMRYEEVRKILEGMGYKGDESGGGSHVIYRKSKCEPISIPKHDPIKRAYIQIVKKAMEEIENE